MNPIRLVYFGQQVRIVDLDHFMERGDLLQVLTMPFGGGQIWVEFKTADHIKNSILGEHLRGKKGSQNEFDVNVVGFF